MELQRKKKRGLSIILIFHLLFDQYPTLKTSVPVPPEQYILDSDDKPTEKQKKTHQPSSSMDADFTANLQFNKFHRITQEELNDLIRDLDLPKSKAELLG